MELELNTLKTKEIEKKVLIIQKEWANSIISIGKAFLNKQDYLDITDKFLDRLYFFNKGKVLFKPTKASNKQFRRSKNEFISYFIGHDKVSDEDKGFALEPWKNIYFENFDTIFFENILISMGNYFFTNYRDEQIKVEYSFGYMLDNKSILKIVFHHSSVPYKVS